MAFEIVLAPEAIADLQALKAAERSAVRRALEVHLGHEPAKTSRSRIKPLRGISRPQYRLRFGQVRQARASLRAGRGTKLEDVDGT